MTHFCQNTGQGTNKLKMDKTAENYGNKTIKQKTEVSSFFSFWVKTKGLAA